MKEFLIIVLGVLVLGILLFIYCALVLASRADRGGTLGRVKEKN